MPVLRRGRAFSFVTIVCTLVCSPPAGAQSTARAELDLLQTLENVEADKGAFARELIPLLLELARLYARTDRCSDAIPQLNRALDVSRKDDGLFNQRQMELLEPLMDCYVSLDSQADLERELQYVLLLNESTYGKDDPRMLPGLQRIAFWYEEAGRYLSARQLYNRAIKLVRKTGGKDDLGMVDPLRGLARAYRLEYMHGLQQIDAQIHWASPLRSGAQFQGTTLRLDAVAERSLLRALSILNLHPEADREQRLDTLLELGDWYQMLEAHRDAVRTYKQAWQVLNTPGAPGVELFNDPMPILYRPRIGIALRRPPPEKDRYRRYSVAMDFTVTRDGRVSDVVVIESDAPKDLQAYMAESLEKTRYRPRFVEGEPVDTPKMHHRQGLYVPK